MAGPASDLSTDERVKHLKSPGRLSPSQPLIAYDKSGEIGLWYLPPEPGHGNEGFDITPSKRIAIEPGETPVDAYRRVFKEVDVVPRIFAEEMQGPDCGVNRPRWRHGSEAGLIDDLKTVLRQTARKAGIDLGRGSVMMFCRTGTPSREPSLELGIGDIVFQATPAVMGILRDLYSDLERLWPAMVKRNYPVGCSCRSTDRHWHSDIRFLLFLELSPMTAHETMEDAARYQELERGLAA